MCSRRGAWRGNCAQRSSLSEQVSKNEDEGPSNNIFTLRIARHSLLITHCSLLATHCSLLLTHRSFAFGYKIICVQRNNAIALCVTSSYTVASQTWVVRPPCINVASQRIAPSRAVPKKWVFNSIVVKLVAPSGSEAMQP